MTNRAQEGFLEQVDAMHLLGDVISHLGDVYLFVKDVNGTFVWCNRAFAQLVGAADEAAVVGRTDDAFFPRHLCDTYASDDRTVVKTRRPLLERIELIRDKDGKIAWFSTTKVPAFAHGGALIGVAGITRDLKRTLSKTSDFMAAAPVVEAIVNDYAQPLSIERLARQAGLSVSQFARRFKRRFGVTPLRYLIQVRIDAACTLLTTSDLTVAAIAAETGFYDQSHFTHQFVRHKGLSPSEYRRRYRLAAE